MWALRAVIHVHGMLSPSQTLQDSAQHLSLRPEGFGQLLEEIGFSPGRRLGVTGEGRE